MSPVRTTPPVTRKKEAKHRKEERDLRLWSARGLRVADQTGFPGASLLTARPMQRARFGFAGRVKALASQRVATRMAHAGAGDQRD